jgi:hypothetical protein
MDNWISVKDRLPVLIPHEISAASEYVLVFLDCKVKDPQTMIWKAYYTKDGWAYDYGDPMTIEDANAITHWMPLPNPPLKLS